MKKFFQILLVLGILNTTVGVIEFYSNTKMSGSIVLGIITLAIAFGGLLILKAIKRN